MNNDEELSKKVHSWLETQGYATEMKVAMQLKKYNFGVLQSFYYDDPETNISREIDVIARSIDNGGLLEMFSVIECKKSQKPWIVFTSEASVQNRITSFAVMGETTKSSIIKNITKMLQIDWLRKEGRVGYSITEAFTNKEDSSFKAGISATKAAISLSKSNQLAGVNYFNFYFPTVVFDGQLFECYLDENGNSVVNEVSSVFLNFQIKFGEYQGASIHIVKLDFFETYCRELEKTFIQLKQILKLDRKRLALSLGMDPNLVED